MRFIGDKAWLSMAARRDVGAHEGRPSGPRPAPSGLGLSVSVSARVAEPPSLESPGRVRTLLTQPLNKGIGQPALSDLFERESARIERIRAAVPGAVRF